MGSNVMIARIPFGKTGHCSSRAIFGSAGLGSATQAQADRALDMLLEFGVNHIDTAPRYGDAELRVGAWMKRYRKQFFLATKTSERSYQAAKEQFHRSLDRLQVDHVDLLQLHNLTDVVDREIIMRSGGALDFLVEAKGNGSARFIGITGHGLAAPGFHRRTLERFAFDSILLPCNYLLMQKEDYAEEFSRLTSDCHARQIAVQTIKSIARRYWGNTTRNRSTWYEPLTDERAIIKCVHWVMSIPHIFLNTVGDLTELPKVLKAAVSFAGSPSKAEMDRLVTEMNMETLFS